jgi:hypothetical protein
VPPRFTRVFRIPHLPHDGNPPHMSFQRRASATVCCAIISSSLVGTQTDTRLLGAEMRGPPGTFIEWKLELSSAMGGFH